VLWVGSGVGRQAGRLVGSQAIRCVGCIARPGLRSTHCSCSPDDHIPTVTSALSHHVVIMTHHMSVLMWHACPMCSCRQGKQSGEVGSLPCTCHLGTCIAVHIKALCAHHAINLKYKCGWAALCCLSHWASKELSMGTSHALHLTAC
jgi:hypothetical protein